MNAPPLLIMLVLWAAACSPGAETRELRDAKGRLIGRVERVNGEKHGAVEWRYATGELKLTGRYEHDRKDGTWTTFSRNGDTLSVCGYRQGLPHGWRITRSNKGRLLRRERFHDGLPDGPMALFTEDGDTLEISQYVHGELDGLLRRWSYNDEGELDRRITGHYDHGAQVGDWTYRYADGSLRSISPYVDGKLHGVVRKWRRNGSLELEQVWQNGELIRQRNVD